MSEANLQADGLVERPVQGAAGQQETEEEDSSPRNSPTLFPVQRPPTGHLNMNYCLEIQVTLTDELGDTPPTLTCLDDTSGRRYTMGSEGWTHGGSDYWPR